MFSLVHKLWVSTVSKNVVSICIRYSVILTINIQHNCHFHVTICSNCCWQWLVIYSNENDQYRKIPWSYYTYSVVHELKGFLFQVPVVHMHLELTNMQMNNQIWENPLKKFHLLNNAYDSQKTIALLFYLIEW